MSHRPSRREFAAGLASLAAGALLLPHRSAAQSARPHRIDFHCHSVPPAWVAFLKAQGLGAPGNSWRLAKHLEDMDRAGVATSLLSLASPGIWHGRDLAAIRRVAREVNEFNTTLGADYPGRFGHFATLPLMDVEGSLIEAEYALDVLKADGVCMRTPYGNTWHGDPVFAPLYEELNRRSAVVFTHPQDAACCEDLVPGIDSQSAIEYGTHTTRTIVSLLESGMAARFPNIRWVFAHAGGTMPFLLARIVGRKLPVGAGGLVMLDPSDNSRSGGRERLSQIRRFFYETAQQTNIVALGALRRVVPVSQIVFGTDYPASDSGGRASPLVDHATGLAGVFSGEELRAVESENALGLFPKYRMAAGASR
jgi:predicted TIM-barrel fold metal-dependent hydrolase